MVPNRKTSRVLVVGNDSGLSVSIQITLREAGFTVILATTGTEALADLDRESPDAVVLDLRLPDGLGGAVLQRLRDGPGPPDWVVISALDRDQAIAQYGPVGRHFLVKPFNPWDLARLLGAILKAGDQR